MQVIGTDDAGFSVDVDAVDNLVRIVGWGFWGEEVASAFDKIVIEACRYAPRGAGVSMDMGRLKPMRDEGQRAFAHVIGTLKDFRIGLVSVITASQLTKLQLMRIARASAPKDKVQFSEAM